jgi:hypothetical protein
MRNVLTMMCAAAFVLGAPMPAGAGTFDAVGKFVGAVSPQISRAVTSFPAGGAALANQTAALVEADPSLADDFVFVARNANPGQKQAIAAGLALAANYFAGCAGQGDQTCRRAERSIFRALQFADPEIRSAFLRDVAPEVAEQFGEGRPSPVFIPAGGAGGGVGGGGCITVSPARPGC